MTPASLLEELLRFRSASTADTVRLKELKHDDVCDQVKDRIDEILGAFEKYRHIAYVVQGPRDNGVDVLLKGALRDDEPERYFAFQVKSYEELEDRKNELTKQLKAGYLDATSSYGDALERFYILLCGDADKLYKRINANANEFAKLRNVRVLGPREVLGFLELPSTTVAAVVDRHLSEEDYVRKSARHEVAGFDNRMLFFFLACVCRSLEQSERELLEDFFEHDPRMTELEDRFGYNSIPKLLDLASDTILESHAAPYSRRVRIEEYPAVRALYFDIQVRYSENDDELFEHLYEFLKESDERDGI